MKNIFVIVTILFCTNVFAGTQTGKVKEILVRDDGLHYFYLEGVASARPDCARNDYWMIRDENSAAGKAQLSILLTAQASGRSVYVVGKNSCTRWSDGEDASLITISQ
jgi:hypothetical protein